MLDRLLQIPNRVSDFLASRAGWVRWVFVGVVVVVLLFVTVRYVEKASKPSDAGTQTRTAFLRWRPQILKLDDGRDIYREDEYPNPPIMALVLRPLVGLPPLAGAVTWLLLKMAMAVALFGWAFKLVEQNESRLPLAARGLAVLLAGHSLIGDLQHGNVNIFIAFLVFACLELVRRGWQVSAGVVLALAIACKVTPALFVPYLGWKVMHAGWLAVKDQRPILTALWKNGGAVLAGCGVGLGVWLFVVPGAVLGWERNVTLLTSWCDQMVKPFLVDGKVTTWRSTWWRRRPSTSG